tara:strand:- start:640 stop:975 length:336 start_codon:yes stop_codon:yes gene_type:complete
MRELILIIFLFFGYEGHSQRYASNSQKIRVVQINAKWNQQNTLYLDNLKGCKYEYAWLEEQPSNLKSQIKSVPVILIWLDGKRVKTYQAGLDFKLPITKDNIQEYINELNK